jgi:DNA-cytosine methyltransferase
MRHGSLFSGIGGFDLAAEWMGWENIFHCEWNPFGQRVLKYHFPKAISYEDITKTDFTIHRGSIDILSGGFPCQPYSSAGRRLGKEDERHLWPQMLRAIREIQPRWIVGENVLGIVNWSGGLVFEEIQVELENEGYKVQAYILPAVSVNAPHVRQRVFFIAYSDRCGYGGFSKETGDYKPIGSREVVSDIGNNGNTIWSETERCSETSTDTDNNGFNKEWGHDGSSQNDERSKKTFIGSTNTKESDGFYTHGNIEREPRIDGGIGREGYVEKNQVTNEGGISELDNKSWECKRDVGEIADKVQHSGTLVSEGGNRIQLPLNRGLEQNKTNIQSSDSVRFSDDLSRVNRMDRHSTDTELNSKRQNIGGDSEEKGDLRRGEESDVFGTFCGIGDATDTECDGLEHRSETGNIRSEEGETRREGSKPTNESQADGNDAYTNSEVLEHGNGEGETGGRANKKIRTEPFDSPGDWSAFPTVPPICVRDDGFSNRLDGITFPKWRNESIKAAGNAVVPQLILQLFKTIAEYERIANSEKDNG